MSSYGLLFDSHFRYGINIWFILEKIRSSMTVEVSACGGPTGELQ